MTYIIIFLLLILIKVLSIVLILILKIKYLSKDKDLQFSQLEKTTYLEWDNEYGYWYIIPTISIYKNNGFGISFMFLKVTYGQYWKVRTCKEDDAISEAVYKVKEK